jgi:hypothetical protein
MWAIIDARTHNVLLARNIPKVLLVRVGATSVLNAVQMVLIHPKIIFDPLHPEGGVLRVSFPAEAELEAFEVPLAPSSETLETWERYVPSSLSSTTT